MPRELLHRPALDGAGCFQVVDRDGKIWADGIPDEPAARFFAASPALLLGYDEMLDEVFASFDLRWDFGCRVPDLQKLIEDDGELGERYPGAPEHARWYHELRAWACQFEIAKGESPIEPDIDPQEGLF